MKHWWSNTSVKALNSWAVVPCALQSCAIFSFFLSSTNPGLHLEKKKIWYPSCTAPPPHLFILIKIFFKFCRWCSRRQPEDVICLPLTCEPHIDYKKRSWNVWRKILGKIKKMLCGLRLANLYIRKKHNFCPIWGHFHEKSESLFQKFLSSYRGQGNPPSEKAPKKFLTRYNGATFRKLITTGNEIKPI